MSSIVPYPVLVTADHGQPLSRWLWLVKWLLLIPHAVSLGLLWLAYAVLSVVAFAAILVSGRYPRVIFEFNRGVLRWTWRVSFYGYSALGTDEYPPFTLGPVPWYPATLDVERPAGLSRGRAFVQAWLLALPQLLVVVLFTGTSWLSWTTTYDTIEGPVTDYSVAPGLIGVLALFAGIALLFSGRHPRGLFDLLIGLNRWVLRVVAYASLMTDRYPPFRLDLGGAEEDPSGTREPMRDDGPPWPGAAVALVVAGTLVLMAFSLMILLAVITAVAFFGPAAGAATILMALSSGPMLIGLAGGAALVGGGLAYAARRLPADTRE